MGAYGAPTFEERSLAKVSYMFLYGVVMNELGLNPHSVNLHIRRVLKRE